jgi:acyl carrier protein
MEELARILAEVFGLPESKIGVALTKADIDSWDSLKQMDLVVSLEEHYNIEFEITEIVAMTSVAKIVEILQSKGVLK